MNQNEVKIGGFIRRKREIVGVSRRVLAEWLVAEYGGTRPGWETRLHQYEHDYQVPRFDHLVAICRLLNIAPDEIFEATEESLPRPKPLPDGKNRLYTIGECLARARNKSGLSQRELAWAIQERFGTLALERSIIGSLNTWENDRAIPKIDAVLRISRCAGVGLDEMFEDLSDGRLR